MPEDDVVEDSLVGTKIADLVVGTIVGSGGTATVYRAERAEPVLVVRALKVMHREPAKKLKQKDKRREKDRFREEARLLEKLEHKNIVKFYDAREERGRLVLVLEFLEGKTLRGYIEEWHDTKTTPPLDLVLEVMCQAAEGVAFAHGFEVDEDEVDSERTLRKVVVHRDLKPDNLFVTKKQITKVLDFGIAKALDDAERATQTTTSTFTMATAKYLAPELWEGTEAPTPTSDVYSLGITLFEALAARHPFDEPDKPIKKNNTGYYTSHHKDERPQLSQVRPDVPASLDEVVRRAIAKEVSVRYPTAKEFGEALRAVQRELALAKRPRPAVKVDVVQGSSEVGGIRSDIPLRKPPKIEPATSIKLPQPAEPEPTRQRSRWWIIASALAFVVCVVVVTMVWSKKPHDDVSMNPAASSASASGSAAASAPAPSASFVAASLPSAAPASPCPEGMKLIPAGTFKMGSETGPDDEKGDEPQPVAAFCMDVTEVTVEAYEECVKTNGCKAVPVATSFRGQFCNANRTGREKYPINCVDWEMAKTYCANRANRLPPDRLPTEREWEYAARGTDGRKYPWDPKLGEPRKGLLNACGSECVAMLTSKGQTLWEAPMYKEDDGFADTAPVGSFPEGKSFYELLDMAGNVSEWTDSLYTASHKSGPNNESRVRVIRGGGWREGSGNVTRSSVRVSERSWGPPTESHYEIGFRCARTLP